MSNSCILRPENKQGQSPKLFNEIKEALSNQLGKSPEARNAVYETTWKLYGLAISSNFRKDFKESLSFDAEGFPTFNSLMENKYAKTILGNDLHNKVYEGNFIKRPNTTDNYFLSLDSAMTFNKSHQNKIATVVVNEDNELVVRVKDRTPEGLEEFKKQYASMEIAKGVSKILEPLGISIGEIIGEEANIRNGKVDFSRAKDILDSVNNLIMVANNMQGAKAIGEEFSHLLVGTRRDNPLIQRLITSLSNNEEALKAILGDKYEAEVVAQDDDMSKVAEEALGQLLHKHLIDNQVEKTFEENNDTKVSEGFLSSIKRLFDRVRTFIVNKFKGNSPSATSDILAEAEYAMSSIAKEVVSGNLSMTKKDIKRSYSNTVLNDLNEQMTRNIDVLKAAIKVEQKRFTITDDANKKVEITDILSTLEQGTAPSADSLLSIFRYLEYATKELVNQNASLSRYNTLDTKQKFQTLRRIRSYVQSFDPIVTLLCEVSGANDEDSDPNTLDKKFVYNGNTVTVTKQLKELSTSINLLKGQYRRLVIPTFAKFLEPFVGEIKANDGSSINLEDMLRTQTGDISLLDRWLDSMADSSDQLLQSLDSVYRAQKDKARLKSLKDIRKIQALQKRADELGITNFEWMFEKYKNGNKTGNYIQKINSAQFYADLKEFNEYLENKYGKNPRDPAIVSALRAEKQAWYNSHAQLNLFGDYEPDSNMYKNRDYERLPQSHKDLLHDYQALKNEFDQSYPSDKVGYGAIQIRKDSIQRYIDMAKSPGTIIDSVKNAWDSTWANQEDDDQLYGERKNKGLMGFDGRQFNILPILYQHRLKDPNEISTDVFSSLTAYAISANDYDAVSEVVDALEVGRTLVTDKIRKTEDTISGNPIVETLRVNGEEIKQRILKGNTALEDKLDEWFDSQIYKKKYAEETEFSIPILNKRISTVKLTGKLTSMASTCQLAFNWLANMANVATGIAMTNIDTVWGEFYRASDLAFADKEYASMMPSFMKEMNSRYKTNKLALFDELFNIKYQFDNRGKESQKPSALQRIFGKSIAFIGQDGGDHWLYNRIAIAMAHREKVKVPDGHNGYKEMSLWDALQVINSNEGNGLKEMKLPDDTLDSKGRPFDIGKYSRKIGKVSQRVFGIYNEEDRNAAQRHSLGRLMLMYRQWMKPQFNTRFQAKQYNQTLEAYEEGYYRTMVRLAADFKLSPIKLISEWDSLEDYEKHNVVRALVEVSQLLAVLAIAKLVEWPDDKKRPWLLKLAEYMAVRETHELGNLVPSPIMIRELTATIKSPSAALSIVESVNSWVSTLLTPNEWNDEIQSGPWEGHSTLYKKTLKLPVPMVQWYNQIDKFTGGLEDKINYYARTQAQ